MAAEEGLSVSKIKNRLLRNRESIGRPWNFRRGVILEWWNKKTNIGDQLSPLIVGFMRERLRLSDMPAKSLRRIHLMALGSLIGMRRFDAVIWGSGIHCQETAENVARRQNYVHYDVRIVRGPVTAEILKKAGYEVPDVYGDPAVLMPLIYESPVREKKYPVSVIPHVGTPAALLPEGVHVIRTETDDYRAFIDEIVSSERIISSSLHGIILAEAYGVPAVFCAEGMENEKMKFTDWYAATGRPAYRCAGTFSEALTVPPMDLPELAGMREALIRTFPKELWKSKK